MSFWQKEVIGMTYKTIAVKSVIALIILFIGIIIGKVMSSLLNKALDKARIEKTKAYNFFKMLVVIIKWAIYIMFLNLSIRFLSIPQFTYWLTDILVIIPALIGGLLLIVVGFAIAVYLKRAIEESKVENCEVLSNIFFYFIVYVFMVFALKTALISMDTATTNILVIILTGIIAAGIAYRTAKTGIKKKK
jgi:hypothetical protein